MQFTGNTKNNKRPLGLNTWIYQRVLRVTCNQWACSFFLHFYLCPGYIGIFFQNVTFETNHFPLTYPKQCYQKAGNVTPDSRNPYGWYPLKMHQITRASPAELRTIVRAIWRSIGYTTICASNRYILDKINNSASLIQRKMERLKY